MDQMHSDQRRAHGKKHTALHSDIVRPYVVYVPTGAQFGDGMLTNATLLVQHQNAYSHFKP